MVSLKFHCDLGYHLLGFELILGVPFVLVALPCFIPTPNNSFL